MLDSEQIQEKQENPLANLFGQIAMLLSTAPQYEHFFISDLKWLVWPAIRTQQFRVWQHNGQPAGLALWANVSDAVDQRLSQGESRLSPEDWNSGDQAWLQVWITPETDNMSEVFMYDLCKTPLAGKTIKYHRVDTESKKLQVVGFDVPNAIDQKSTSKS